MLNKESAKLIEWYEAGRRDFPWRRTNDPYRIWIAEVMLQQTQTETVVPYYIRFLERFPDVRSLRAADLSEVLKAWEGLGYYSRARNLHRAARIIVDEHRGSLPADCRSLKQIPGIGDYTAAAIASIAFGEAVPVLDGNARRVFARWVALPEDPRSREGLKKLRAAAGDFLDRSRPGLWNQAVMELGATVCVPGKPRCSICPVSQDCRAFLTNSTDKIPLKAQKKRIPHHQVTAGVIRNGANLLIARRYERGLLGGLWEFPGGKQEDGETLQECLNRELREELGIEVEVGQEMCAVNHAYSHFRITLHVFSCRYLSGTPQALGCAEWKWVKPSELTRYAFSRADRSVIELLVQENTS